MTTPRSPRRIVPPSIPVAPGAAPPPIAYAPPKYVDPERSSLGKVIALGAASFVVVAGALLALQTWRTPQDPAILAAIEERAAELQGARQERARDATAAGWVGVLEMPIERATVSIDTIPDDGRTARDWNENAGEPVSIALLSIDNSSGAQEVVVDTAQATVQLADGTSKPAVDPLMVLQTVKRDRENALREMAPPFRCKVGERMTGKFLFLPQGLDAHAIASITLSVNGKPQQITGSFMDAQQKAAATRTAAMRAGPSSANNGT